MVLHNENNAVISMDDVNAMEFQDLAANAVPVPAQDAEPEISIGQLHQRVMDAYSKTEEVGATLKADLLQTKTVMEQKLNYVIDVLECRARVVDPARRAPASVELGSVVHSSEPVEDGGAPVIEEVDEQVDGTERPSRRRRR